MDTADDLRKMYRAGQKSEKEHKAAGDAAEKHLNEVVLPAENSWFMLEQVIHDPDQIEQLFSDRGAIAVAFEYVAKTAERAGHAPYVRRALQQAEGDLLTARESHSKKAQNDSQDELTILMVVCAALDAPGSASDLTSVIEIKGFPRNAVSGARAKYLGLMEADRKEEAADDNSPKIERQMQQSDAANEIAVIPAEYRDLGKPDGNPLTVKYVSRPEIYDLKGPFLSRQQPPLETVKDGKANVYLFSDITRLSAAKNMADNEGH